MTKAPVRGFLFMHLTIVYKNLMESSRDFSQTKKLRVVHLADHTGRLQVIFLIAYARYAAVITILSGV